MRVDNAIQKIASSIAALGIIGSIIVGVNTNTGLGVISGISVIFSSLLLYGFGALIESVRNIEDILLKKEGAKNEEH